MTSARSISIRSRRLNLPLQLGVQLGAARLFAGASFVIGDWTGNSDAARLGVDYDMPDVAIVGGASVHFSNMFVEARLRSATGSRHALFRIGDAVRSMAIRRNMLWSLSFGIFF